MCGSYEMSSKDGKIQSLVIRSLTIKDTGVYTCKIGDRHTEATLTVNESKQTPSLLLLLIKDKPIPANNNSSSSNNINDNVYSAVIMAQSF